MHCVHLESVDSTHLWARRRLKRFHNPTMISADRQTAGIGRSFHQWHSEPGDLMVTFVHPCNIEWQQFITPILAKACLSLCEQYGLHATFTFPNDIFLKGKKVAGVLTTIGPRNIAINSLGDEYSHDTCNLCCDCASRDFMACGI